MRDEEIIGIVSKIAWSHNQWRGACEEDFNRRKEYGFKFVQLLGYGHEFWNFYENFDDERYYGSPSHVMSKSGEIPNFSDRDGLIVFISKNPEDRKQYFIGFYGKGRSVRGLVNVGEKIINLLPERVREHIEDLINDEREMDSLSREEKEILGRIRGIKEYIKEVARGDPLKMQLIGEKKFSTLLDEEGYVMVSGSDIGVKRIDGSWSYAYINRDRRREIRQLFLKAREEHEKLLNKELDQEREQRIRSVIEKINWVLNEYFSGEDTDEDEVWGEVFDRLKDLLRVKNQVILYGPPGTGKTWLAREFVRREVGSFEGDGAWRVGFVVFHPSYSYEEFVEGVKARVENGNIVYYVGEGIFKELCRKAYNALIDAEELKEFGLRKWEEHGESGVGGGLPELTNEAKEAVKAIVDGGNCPSFYLVIDEINRGDVSKIFGELISLLEEDKRLFAENELVVTLPYSKERFGVPPNLYIIGTMNTADRSIALIDVALRRRFGFMELMPDYKLLMKELNIKDADTPDSILDWSKDDLEHDLKKLAVRVLYVLNQKIQLIYDRDHQIGHSYFLRMKDGDEENVLMEIWYNEVLPLLNEYFYNDWEKLKFLLGDFVEEKRVEVSGGGLVDEDAAIFEFRRLKGEEFKDALVRLAEVSR